MAYGIWESKSWCHKLQEGAQEYWSKATPGGLLFGSMYGALCHDRGDQDPGTLEHKAALLAELSSSHLYTTKGPRVPSLS
eukprot:6207801-Lingulodinium_polyedra.AAC.1